MSIFLRSLSRLHVKSLDSLCVFPKSMSTMTAVARRIAHGKRLGPSVSSESSLRLNTPRRLLVQPEKKNPSFASFSSTSKKLASETMAEKIQPEGIIEQIKYNPHLKSRFNQSLFNWVFSFSAMILAAQSLKSSKERQKVQRKLEESESISQERLHVLQSLVEPKTLEPITQRILVELSQQQLKSQVTSKERSGWFGSSAAKQHGIKDDKGLSEKVVSKILLEEMFRLVGEKALDEAQREVFMAKNLTTGDGENDKVKNVDPEKLMVGGAAENPAPTTRPAEKRKKAFTM